MFVSVGYYDERLQGFKTSGYSYETALPLEVGNVVAAPVKNRGTGAVEDKKAVVLAVNLPEPSFKCSEITQMWTEAEATP